MASKRELRQYREEEREMRRNAKRRLEHPERSANLRRVSKKQQVKDTLEIMREYLKHTPEGIVKHGFRERYLRNHYPHEVALKVAKRLGWNNIVVWLKAKK